MISVPEEERAECLTVDLGGVESVGEIHTRLSKGLGFPTFYGRNWNAFWDAITGLVEMPRRLVFKNWGQVANRFPDDVAVMVQCLTDMNAEYPDIDCTVIYED